MPWSPRTRSQSRKTFGAEAASVGQCYSRQPVNGTQLHRSQRRKRSGSRLGGFEARRRITRLVSGPVVSRTGEHFLSSFSSLPFVRANGRFQGQSSNCAIRVTSRTSRQPVWPLSRSNAVETGKRDRPGRSVRRLAEQRGQWILLTEWRAKVTAEGTSAGRRRQRSRRPRSPSATAWFPVRGQAVGVRAANKARRFASRRRALDHQGQIGYCRTDLQAVRNDDHAWHGLTGLNAFEALARHTSPVIADAARR